MKKYLIILMAGMVVGCAGNEDDFAFERNLGEQVIEEAGVEVSVPQTEKGSLGEGVSAPNVGAPNFPDETSINVDTIETEDINNVPQGAPLRTDLTEGDPIL